MRAANARTTWLMSFAEPADPEWDLVCFPHAGGGGNVFGDWQSHSEALRVSGLRLPGRERRIGEPVPEDVGELADAIVTGLQRLYDKPYAFYGHSMGALVAYEVTTRLHATELPLPRALFVAGRDGPQFPDTDPAHELPRDELVEWLLAGDGLSPEVLDYPELIDLMLPTIRADLRMAERYEYRQRPALPVPIHVLRGRSDHQTAQAEDGGWALHTTVECTVTWFDGGHFFVHDHAPRITELVETRLRAAEEGR